MELHINKESMKSFASEKLFIGVVEVLLGIALILLREFAFDLLVMGIGVIILILGIVLFIGVIKRPKEFVEWYSFILPVISIILGVFCLIFPTKIIRILALLIGVFIIIKGVVNIFAKKSSDEKKIQFLISNIISIVLGAIILLTLNNSDSIFAIILAIDLILSGIVDFLMYFDAKKLIKASGDDEEINIELEDK